MAFEGILGRLKTGKGGEKPSVSSVEKERSADILENVRFSPVFDGKGRLIRYKSSELGRKEVRFDQIGVAELQRQGTERAYRVRIKSDSNPEDPTKGYYVVEIVNDNEAKEAAAPTEGRIAFEKVRAALTQKQLDLYEAVSSLPRGERRIIEGPASKSRLRKVANLILSAEDDFIKLQNLASTAKTGEFGTDLEAFFVRVDRGLSNARVALEGAGDADVLDEERKRKAVKDEKANRPLELLKEEVVFLKQQAIKLKDATELINARLISYTAADRRDIAQRQAQRILSTEERLSEFLVTARTLPNQEGAKKVLESLDLPTLTGVLNDARQSLDKYAGTAYLATRKQAEENRAKDIPEYAREWASIVQEYRAVTLAIREVRELSTQDISEIQERINILKQRSAQFVVDIGQGDVLKSSIASDIDFFAAEISQNLSPQLRAKEAELNFLPLRSELNNSNSRLSSIYSEVGSVTTPAGLAILTSRLTAIEAQVKETYDKILDTTLQSTQRTELERQRQTIRSLIVGVSTLIAERSKELATQAASSEVGVDKEETVREIEERIRNEQQSRDSLDIEDRFGRVFGQPMSLEALVKEFTVYQGIDMKSRHKEVLRVKAGKFQRSRPLQALASMLHDPDLNRSYHLMMGRKEEMLDDQKPDERHRSFGPLLASLMMHERTKALADLAINESVRERSDLLKDLIQEGMDEEGNYVPEVVIGSGVHSAIYAVNRQMVRPDNPSLTLERASVIGGQFAQMGGALFGLNSRTRPELRGEAYVPGSPNSLNTLTTYATTQPGDTGGEKYQKQSVLGDHARMNLFLSGEPVVNAQVRRVRRNETSNARAPLYVVEFLDTATNRILEVTTDRVVFSTGVGEEESRLDETDIDTKEILAAEKKKFDEGKDAAVLSFAQATQLLANPENPFPLKGFKNIILSGEGDGGKVIAGVLLGYEGQLAMTTTQLDSIERIVWIGQSFPTKEDFIENCRARYHQIGLEFPRKQFDDYYRRILPLPDARATRLKKNGDLITVSATSTDGSFAGNYTGDHFIYSHGFADKTNEVVAPLYASEIPTTDLLESRDRFNQTLAYVPALIFFKQREGSELARIETKRRTTGVEITRVNRDGSFTVSDPSTFDSQQLYQELSARQDDIDYITQVEGYATEAEVYRVEGDAAPTARKYKDAEVYKVGPAANLPLSAQEKGEVEALSTIPENTAAVFRYAEMTARLALSLARNDTERTRSLRKSPLFTAAELRHAETRKKLPEKTASRSPEKEGVRTRAFTVSPRTAELSVRIPYDMPASDLLRLGVGSVLEGWEAPESVSVLEVSVTPIMQQGIPSGSYTVDLGATLPAVYAEAVRASLEQELSQVALQRLFELPHVQRQSIKISLPFSRGTIDAGKIGYSRQATPAR